MERLVYPRSYSRPGTSGLRCCTRSPWGGLGCPRVQLRPWDIGSDSGPGQGCSGAGTHCLSVFKVSLGPEELLTLPHLQVVSSKRGERRVGAPDRKRPFSCATLSEISQRREKGYQKGHSALIQFSNLTSGPKLLTPERVQTAEHHAPIAFDGLYHLQPTAGSCPKEPRPRSPEQQGL